MPPPVFGLAGMAGIDAVKKRFSIATEESIGSIAGSIC